MTALQKNQLQEMRFIDCEQVMFGNIARWAAEFGFDFCSFGMRTPLPVTNPVVMAISSYPDVLTNAYELADYISIDPIIHHALGSAEMILWTTDERFSLNPEVWHAARSAGVCSGISQPTRGIHGVVGLLNLSCNNRRVSAGEVEEKKAGITWLANVAHHGLSRYLVKNFMPATEATLSERELTVLRWTAEGKTSGDIAKILLIAERTVNFHINNAVAKLGASNRTAAAVQAAVLGLLE